MEEFSPGREMLVYYSGSGIVKKLLFYWSPGHDDTDLGERES